MRKNLLLSLFFTCSLFTFQSCADYNDDNTMPSGNNNGGGSSGNGSGNNNGGGNNTNNANLPIKIKTSGYTIDLKYDNNDRFIEVIRKESNGSFNLKVNLNYSSDTLKSIVALYYNDMSKNTTNFNYKNDTIYAVRSYEGATTKITDKLSVNKQGMLLNIKGHYKTNDRYFNNDSSGNIILFNNNGHEGILTYDSYNGVFSNVKLPFWVKAYVTAYYIHPSLNYNYANNVVSINYNSNNWTDEKFLYTFNKDNYPIQVSHTSSVGTAHFEINYTK